MAHYNAEAEPFEESQGNRSAKASPDELKAFYHEMQKTDLERKLSKRKSSSGSIWSRKSKRTSTSQTQSPQSPAPAPSRKPPSLNHPSTTSIARVPSSSREHGGDRIDAVPPMPLSRSIIPEPLNELPAWYRDSAYFTTRYPMHNPVGPKWYKNHHLVPPSTSRLGGHPPSVFSTSFPPMAPGDRSETNLRRSPSKSPLPTPNSSQIRMEDVSNLPRSRKTSQTAHDNVDLMDVSDPWGTPWHHESPYDVGKSNSPVSAEEVRLL
ncbi:hypothetical protein GGX14DRAFT_589340 [Mycena pura]|uniref:Uncharacterized protein n=1 Tax=Mycena pura TaxID=153505 RepID=A0AAD6Y2E0_9AGAR|nr:hypothetical protein GGX14DRAFT_589340 [Mycena pura]